jgi:hypothetical protein
MSATTREASSALLGALTEELLTRAPRPDAASEIDIRPVPMRTCYETMTRLQGPNGAVLDYAAYLFAEEQRAATTPTPPLAVDDVQVDLENGEMVLVLSRGTFTAR